MADGVHAARSDDQPHTQHKLKQEPHKPPGIFSNGTNIL